MLAIAAGCLFAFALCIALVCSCFLLGGGSFWLGRRSSVPVVPTSERFRDLAIIAAELNNGGAQRLLRASTKNHCEPEHLRSWHAARRMRRTSDPGGTNGSRSGAPIISIIMPLPNNDTYHDACSQHVDACYTRYNATSEHGYPRSLALYM